MILPFRCADLLENSSPWWQGFCTRVKTKHLVFDVMGEAVISCGLIAAAHTCPLGQVPLSSVGARHWAGTGCCTWKTQSSHCTVGASWARTNRQDPSLHGLTLKRQREQMQTRNRCRRSHQVRMRVIKIIKQGGMVESDRGRNVCGAQKRDSHKINMYLNYKKEPKGHLGRKNSKCTGSEVLATSLKHRPTIWNLWCQLCLAQDYLNFRKVKWYTYHTFVTNHPQWGLRKYPIIKY